MTVIIFDMPQRASTTAAAPARSEERGPAPTQAGAPGRGAGARGAQGLMRAGTRGSAMAWAACTAVPLLVLWLAAGPRTPDLAAASYRAALFAREGPILYDTHWYGGHLLPAYSLLLPPLGALAGVRLLGALAVLASCLLFARLLEGVDVRAARWASAVFALAAVGDVWSGRVAFALGVPFALAAALAWRSRHPGAAAALSVLAAVGSPVAGALLALGAVSVSLVQRRRSAALVLALPALVVIGAIALLFPEGGFEPYPIRSFAATAVVMIAFLLALPRAERVLRTGALLYLGVCTACLLVHSPVGSNVERYGVLLAAPLLVFALARETAPRRAGARVRAAGALALALVWTVWGPVRETRAVAGSPATSAAYYAPLKSFLAQAQQREGPARIEVPLTRSHWEAALLADSVPLARGWEKQLDERYDRVLLSSGLDAASYLRWLQAQAVRYVALPDAPLDSSSAQEGGLVRGGLPYLREVFAGAHWRVYRVLGAEPLVSGPARITRIAPDGFDLLAAAPGRLLVRLHWNRYLTLTGGSGCVGPAPGGWTYVTLTRAGPASVRARFSLGRALSGGEACTSA